MKIDVASLQNVHTYDGYRQLIDSLLEKQQTTNADNSEKMLNYTKLNVQRMQRVEKTTVLQPETIAFFEQLKRPLFFLTLTEGWCGDASQNLPVIEKMARINPLVKHHVILRDEHPAIMDQFLTNGSRSIPIVIFIDGESGETLGHWGPRPSVPQQMAMDYKKNPVKPREEFYTELHLWYSRDKGQLLQKEFVEQLRRVV